MGQLTAEFLKNQLTSLLSSLDATDVLFAKKLLLRHRVRARMFDAATAGTAMTTTTVFTNDFGCTMRLIEARVITPVAVAADNTDYVTFTVSKADADGGSAATMASGDTRAASLNGLAAGDSEALALTVANLDVADGYHVRVAVAKAASGKAITAATSDAYVELTFEPV